MGSSWVSNPASLHHAQWSKPVVKSFLSSHIDVTTVSTNESRRAPDRPLHTELHVRLDLPSSIAREWMSRLQWLLSGEPKRSQSLQRQCFTLFQTLHDSLQGLWSCQCRNKDQAQLNHSDSPVNRPAMSCRLIISAYLLICHINSIHVRRVSYRNCVKKGNQMFFERLDRSIRS